MLICLCAIARDDGNVIILLPPEHEFEINRVWGVNGTVILYF